MPEPMKAESQVRMEQIDAAKAAAAARKKGDIPSLMSVTKSTSVATPADLADIVRNCLYASKMNLVLGATAPATATDPTVSVTADYLSVEGIGFAGISETVSAFDTGAIAADTWYAVWAMCGPHGENLSFRFSTSFTAPTMVADTILKRRIGAVRSNAAGNGFRRFVHINDWWYWNEDVSAAPFLVLATQGAAGTTWTDVSCAAVAPPSARLLDLQFWSWPAASGGASNLQFRGNNQGNVGVDFTAPYISSWVGATGWTGMATGVSGRGMCPCDSSQVIEYYAQAANMDISATVLGYTDVI